MSYINSIYLTEVAAYLLFDTCKSFYRNLLCNNFEQTLNSPWPTRQPFYFSRYYSPFSVSIYLFGMSNNFSNLFISCRHEGV